MELRTVRADLAYRNGRRMLGDVVDRLRKARDEFNLAKKLGTSKPQDVDNWIADVERRIRDYEAPTGPQQPPGAEVPVPTPPAAKSPGERSADPQQPKWRL